ncbi:MAG: carboxymuconolactone decarboxylase family protein [Alphaproteobacteria bacterium]
MPRLNPIDPAQAEGQAKVLLDGVRKKYGMVPNLLATLANAPAALEAYLSLGQALGRSSLDGKTREAIALTVAGENGCDYCAAAHSAIGAGLGMAAEELAANLAGRSSDPRVAAILRFARAVVVERGWVGDNELAEARAAGLGDGEITEIVATVAASIFSNYFNHVAGTEIDFPPVSNLRDRAA